MRVLLAQRDRCRGRGQLCRLRVDVRSIWGEGGEVQQVLVRMRVWLWFTVGTGRRLVAWWDDVAECAVGERPWGLAGGVLEAGLYGLGEACDGGEGRVDAGGGVGDEVEPVGVY